MLAVSKREKKRTNNGKKKKRKKKGKEGIKKKKMHRCCDWIPLYALWLCWLAPILKGAGRLVTTGAVTKPVIREA
ncbi:MAG: hypothetical protein P3M75_00225 [Candidatus Hodgkinia cicadicola]|nr:MAG: hypothetical protein P3M75_00225 [Candidatus Hodgkinia cicadicola]